MAPDGAATVMDDKKEDRERKSQNEPLRPTA